MDLDLLTRCVIFEEVGRTIVIPYRMNEVFGPEVRPPLFYCNDEQKERYLYPVLKGEKRMCFALTEPDAGSDPASMQTRAVKDGDDYIINGTKTWISNGREGNCVALLVKTDTQIEPRHKGMSLFLAEKGPGFGVGKKLKKLGYKGIDSAELIFDDYRISADDLIGGVEGEGFYQTMGGLELGRINVAARGVGVANAALKDATSYAQIRETMGKPIGQHQAIQTKLGDMATRCAAARLQARPCGYPPRDARADRALPLLRPAACSK